MLMNLKWVFHKQHTVESFFLSTLPILLFNYNCPKQQDLLQLSAVECWMSPSEAAVVFRKCQGYLELIYNPAQKCNLTLSICSGFGVASLKCHSNDFLAQLPAPSCVMVSLQGDFLQHHQMRFTFFSLFSQGMEPGMYQLKFRPKSGSHRLQPGFLLFNPWVLARTYDPSWRGFWRLVSVPRERGNSPLNSHAPFKAPVESPWSMKAFLPKSQQDHVSHPRSLAVFIYTTCFGI